MGHKVILIGLDGATYRILYPLMESGKIPNISWLIRNGSHGTLLSTIPPMTAPAWTSLLTGKNPGKHGIFNFLRTEGKTYTTTFYNWSENVLVNATDISSKTLWELAGECGKRVGMVNMPMTYPPMSLNGFMISCMLTPPGCREFTYPADLASEIPDYRIDIECGRGYGQITPAYVRDYRKFFSDIFDILEKRARTILSLMKNQPWDLLMAVFTETDRIHHHFWSCMDPEDPFSETDVGREQRELFCQVYERLDAHIGTIIQNAGESVIILVSDHGFSSGAKYHFNLNSWLRQKGYLVLEGDPVLNWLSLEGPSFLSSYFHRQLPMAENVPVLWKQTRAWGITYLARTGGIKINVKGEMEQGIVPRTSRYNRLILRIKRELEDLRGSDGSPLVKKIYLRDELYQGEFLPNAPEIIFMLDPRYDIPNNFQTDLNSKEMITPVQHVFLTGNHEREGILVMAGAPVLKNTILPVTGIESIAPTILYLLGLPIPDDMDGTVIKDAIRYEYWMTQPIRFCPAQLPYKRKEDRETPGGWRSVEEMEGVKARLRGLGYMD